MYAHVIRIHTLALAPPHHRNRFMALFPGPEENFWTFMVQGKINRGRHIDHPAGRHSIQTNQCQPPPSPHFSPSTKNNLTIMIISYTQVVKIIHIRPHCRHSWTVQSYSLGRANVHPHLLYASLRPSKSTYQTASQLVQPLLQAHT